MKYRIITVMLAAYTLAGPAVGQMQRHSPVQNTPVQKNNNAPQSVNTPQLPEVARGMFAAPPRTGEVTGPSRRATLHGFELIVPEMRIGLPSLRLPSISWTSRNREMRLDSSRAAFVDNPNYLAAMAQREIQLRNYQNAIQQAERRANQAAQKSQLENEYDQKFQLLERKRRTLEQQILEMQNLLQQMKNRVPQQGQGLDPPPLKSSRAPVLPPAQPVETVQRLPSVQPQRLQQPRPLMRLSSYEDQPRLSPPPTSDVRRVAPKPRILHHLIR